VTGVITPTNIGSATLRNSPDVAAEANYDFYVCADQTTCTANYWGGTSFAAPIWAGYLALVNQQAIANGKLTLGFINPTIYALGLTSGWRADFHDIIVGSNGYPAVTGYDLATGWGSPKRDRPDQYAGRNSDYAAKAQATATTQANTQAQASGGVIPAPPGKSFEDAGHHR
jgi:hypothetical protein